MSKYIELSRVLMYIADIQLAVSDISKLTMPPRDLCEWIFKGIKDLPTIEVSEDCISREDAIKAIEAEHISGSIAEIQRIYDADPHSSKTDFEDTLLGIFYAIQDAPSVVPTTEQSSIVGEWELASDDDGEYGYCSICGNDADFTHYGKPYHYCPNCGAKMRLE